ncbi:MAG: hypothetical protein ACK5F4_07350 [Ignavibacteria bacterium]|jgi:hypothetical protein
MFHRKCAYSFLSMMLAAMMIASCTNPFAPKLSDTPLGENVFADQKTVDGIFQNFRSAYLYKDTLAYGRLLDQQFIFIYRNYETGVDGTWGRDQEMFTTSGLFNAAQNLDLIWNDIVVSTGDSTSLDIARGFNLTITFNPQDIVRVQGRVNLQLKRPTSNDNWKIVRWRDESNY